MLSVADKKKQVITIICINVVIHFFMLLVKGAWWDDCKWYVASNADIKAHMITAGRLDAYYLIAMVNWMPAWLFHLTILTCFTVSAVAIYYIILNVFGRQREAFWIAVLYNAIPANDLRVLKCVFPYTVALMCFWVSTYLLTVLVYENKPRKKHVYRVISIALFLGSFTTNSLLFFYIVPICLLWIQIYKKVKAENGSVSVKKLIVGFTKWFDFYIIPFAFYTIKKIWFHPDYDGLYSEYNAVTIEKCVNAIKLLPGAIKSLIYNIIAVEMDVIKCSKWVLATLCIPFILFFVIHICSQNKKSKVERMTPVQLLIGCIVGFFLIMAGIFPYVVVRQRGIGIISDGGRDSLLICIGASVLFVCFCELIELAEWFQNALFLSVVLLAAIHFTNCYTGYLRDHYEQMALETAWLETDDVKEGQTFIYIRQEGARRIGERSHELNAMSKDVYGDSSRYIACGIGGLRDVLTYEKKETMRNDAAYSYNQYDLAHVKIDGVMLASYYMTKSDAIRLRFKEIFQKEQYQILLDESLDYQFIPISAQDSDYILNSYLDGEMTADEELLDWLGIKNEIKYEVGK